MGLGDGARMVRTDMHIINTPLINEVRRAHLYTIPVVSHGLHQRYM